MPDYAYDGIGPSCPCGVSSSWSTFTNCGFSPSVPFTLLNVLLSASVTAADATCASKATVNTSRRTNCGSNGDEMTSQLD
jgi:hypothetical protein